MTVGSGSFTALGTAACWGAGMGHGLRHLLKEARGLMSLGGGGGGTCCTYIVSFGAAQGYWAVGWSQ